MRRRRTPADRRTRPPDPQAPAAAWWVGRRLTWDRPADGVAVFGDVALKVPVVLIRASHRPTFTATTRSTSLSLQNLEGAELDRLWS
jgi:hypothetical protein